MPTETRQKVTVSQFAGGAAGRLFNARKAAVERVKTILANRGENALQVIRNTGADDWRRNRYPRPYAARYSGQWQNLDEVKRPDARAYYVDSFADLGWREIGRADQVARKEGSRSIDHTGWFCDAFQNDTVAGYVLQIPARAGVPQYLPGLAWSGCDGVTVYPLDRYDSALDAARAADSYAEKVGEQERDYSAAWAAGSQWADRGEEIADARREALQILAERRKVKGVEAPALCAAIRYRVESLLEAIQEARQDRGKLASGGADGLSFWTGDRNLISAFNEGAGKPVLA